MTALLQSLVDAVSGGALLALASLGIGLVFGVMRLANFAHGEIITGSSYTLVLTWHLGAVVSLFLCALVGVLLAVLFELVVFRRFRGANPGTLLIASFALSFVVQRIYEIVFGNNVRAASVAPTLTRSTQVLGLRLSLLSLVTIALGGVLLAGVHTFLTRTSLGLQVQAASTDFATARLLGVRANRVIAITFALSGVLAAAVAFVLTVRTGAVSPTFGVNTTVLALIGAVIGGIDKLAGSLLGGFLTGFAASLLSTFLPASAVNFRDAFVFGLVILVLLFRPAGLLLPRATLERT